MACAAQRATPAPRIPGQTAADCRKTYNIGFSRCAWLTGRSAATTPDTPIPDKALRSDCKAFSVLHQHRHTMQNPTTPATEAATPLTPSATSAAATPVVTNAADANSAPGHAPEGVAHPKTIRSYVRRAGRTTTGQAKAFEEFGEQYVLDYTGKPLDTDAVFGRRAPVILEIGFGMGEATAHIARVRPDDNFLCCEVHEPGVGALLKRIGEQELTNIRIFQHDAVEVLEEVLTPGMLDGVHIFFPDPWHKKKHNKRRLIQPPLVAQLMGRLKVGGYIHCATDWQPYAEQMLEVLSANAQLKNTAEGYAPQPDYRPLTKFENRGLRLGHGVWDLVFTRQS